MEQEELNGEIISDQSDKIRATLINKSIPEQAVDNKEGRVKCNTMG